MAKKHEAGENNKSAEELKEIKSDTAFKAIAALRQDQEVSDKDLADLQKTVQTMVNDIVQEIDPKATKTIEQLGEEAQTAVKKTITEVSTQLAMLEAMNEGGIPAQEEIDKLGKIFSKIVTAEALDQEPDFSDLQPPVAQIVSSAIEAYMDKEVVQVNDSLQKRLNYISTLFSRYGQKPKISNYGYRRLTRKHRASIQYSSTGLRHIFSDYRKYNDELDTLAIEKAMRRLDSEIRILSIPEREEFCFVFIEKIIDTFGKDRFEKTWLSSYSQTFNVLSEDSRQILSDLISLYFYLKEHYTISVKGRQYVIDQLRNYSAEDGVEDLIKLQQNTPEREIDRSESKVRPILVKEYNNIVFITESLLRALPNTFSDSVQATLNLEIKPKFSLNNIVGQDLMAEASKTLRQNFIAIVQNRGSFEVFTSSLISLYNLLMQELEEKINIANKLVMLYDNLELDIATVLKESKERILTDLPF